MKIKRKNEETGKFEEVDVRKITLPELMKLYDEMCIYESTQTEETATEKNLELLQLIRLEGRENVRIYIKGNVYLLAETDKVRWFTFMDRTYPITKNNIEDAINLITKFLEKMDGKEESSPLIYSSEEMEYVNRKQIANAEIMITLE